MEPNYDPNRQRRLRRATEDRDSSVTAWKIAAGVFLGLSLFYAVYRVHVAMEQRAAIEQLNQMTAELSKPDADPFGWRAQAARKARAEQQRRTLRPGERCISGQRFERVENGWRQIDPPC